MTHYEISDVFAGFRAIFRGIHENCSHFSPKTSNNVTAITQTCQLFSTPRPANTRSPAYFSVTDPLRDSPHRDAPARADKPIPHHPQSRPARHPRPRPRPRGTPPADGVQHSRKEPPASYPTEHPAGTARSSRETGPAAPPTLSPAPRHPRRSDNPRDCATHADDDHPATHSPDVPAFNSARHTF